MKDPSQGCQLCLKKLENILTKFEDTLKNQKLLLKMPDDQALWNVR